MAFDASYKGACVTSGGVRCVPLFFASRTPPAYRLVMSLSEEQLRSLANAVATWRMQDNIAISLLAFYVRSSYHLQRILGPNEFLPQVYYVVTTLEAEITVIFPERWNRGKALFMIIRYGILVFTALHLARDFRNHFTISLNGCKALHIIYVLFQYAALISCDVVLGLCLSALLRARWLAASLISILSAAPNVIAFVFTIISTSQYPPEEISSLDEELGYPCYIPPSDEWEQSTVSGLRRDIRRYITFSITALLLLLALATFAIRYRGQSGPLFQVLRRDGGLYYIALAGQFSSFPDFYTRKVLIDAALRFGLAIVSTPAILSSEEFDSSPVALLLTVSSYVIVPILAQRLLLNMQKVDHVGSQPFASRLLFASTAFERESSTQDAVDNSIEMGSPVSLRHREARSAKEEVSEIDRDRP
ncbi:hypothetical protein NMY22_g2122 [Coprinellus aureogranulatus]|nr:hypothetical protein NMY22_g2122 [Coprinellus aureogranulatus]